MILYGLFFVPKIHSAWRPVHETSFDSIWFVEFFALVPCRCDCGNEHGDAMRSVLCAWQPVSGYLTAPISV